MDQKHIGDIEGIIYCQDDDQKEYAFYYYEDGFVQCELYQDGSDEPIYFNVFKDDYGFDCNQLIIDDTNRLITIVATEGFC